MESPDERRRVYILRESALAKVKAHIGVTMRTSRSFMDKFEVLVIKKLHWLIGIALTIVTPTVSVTAAYYQGQNMVDAKIAAIRENQEKEFVRKDDFNKVLDRLTDLTREVSRMSGAMEQMNRNKRNCHRWNTGTNLNCSRSSLKPRPLKSKTLPLKTSRTVCHLPTQRKMLAPTPLVRTLEAMRVLSVKTSTSGLSSAYSFLKAGSTSWCRQSLKPSQHFRSRSSAAPSRKKLAMPTKQIQPAHVARLGLMLQANPNKKCSCIRTASTLRLSSTLFARLTCSPPATFSFTSIRTKAVSPHRILIVAT